MSDLDFPYVVYRLWGVQFLGTVYICNQGSLSSFWAHYISCARSACSRCRRYYCCLLHSTDGAWKLAWNLQAVQARITDHNLCLSSIYSQFFLLHCFFPSQEPPDTFLEQFSDDNKAIGIMVLPGDPRAELAWQGFMHNDEHQNTKPWWTPTFTPNCTPHQHGHGSAHSYTSPAPFIQSTPPHQVFSAPIRWPSEALG